MLNKKMNLALLIALFLTGCFSKKGASRTKDKTSQSISSQVDSKGEGNYSITDELDEFYLGEEDPFGENGYAGDQDDFQWDNVLYDTDAGEVVQFDFDDTAIKSSEKNKIQHNADLAKQELRANPNSKVAVKGHSCKIAKSELYNRAISQERAENVAKAYAEQGVSRDKISAVGYGADEPLTDEDGMQAQAINRRVETDFIVE